MTGKIFDVMFSSGAWQFIGTFMWGIASVLLSPCGISAVPLVVGYVSNTDEPSRLHAFKISCAFCLGIVINLLLVAFVTSGLGLMLGGYERFLTVIVSVVFIVMGLHLAGIIHVKFFALGSGGSGTEGQNLKGAVMLGIVSGLAVGPCTIAYVSPVLSLAMSRASSEGFAYSAGLVVSYALGYCAVIVCAGTFTRIFTKYLQSSRGDVILRAVNVICGAGLIAAGVYLLNEMRYLL